MSSAGGGDQHFRDGSAALKQGDRAKAVSHIKLAADSFRSSGDVKKLKLMEGMISKINAEAEIAKKKADVSTAKAHPPKKASPFDYSRFDQIVDSDDEEDSMHAGKMPGMPGVGPPPNIPALPPRLMQAIAMSEEIKARGGTKEELRVAEELAARAMNEASPSVKEGILKTLQQAGVNLDGIILNKVDEVNDGEDHLAASLSKVDQMKASMKTDLDRLRNSMKQIEENEKKLQTVQSPQEMLAFLKAQGATDDELARVMTASSSGDQAAFDLAVKNVMERTMMGKDGLPMDELRRKVDQIDKVTDSVQEELRSAVEGLGGNIDKNPRNKDKGKSDAKEVKPATALQSPEETVQGTAEECKAQGNKLFSAGDFAGAVKSFTQAISLLPVANAGYLTNRAASLLRLGDFDGAVRDADAALAADSSHVKAWFRKGQALEGAGRLDEAETAYRGGLKHMPNSDQLKGGLESVAAKRSEKAQQGTAVASSGGAVSTLTGGARSKEEQKDEGARLLGTAIAGKLKERREDKAAMTGAAAPPPTAPPTAPPAAPPAAVAGGATVRTPEWSAVESQDCLVVSVQMPMLDKGISDLTLDVSSERLVLRALPHYSLDCRLPSKVNGDQAAAKFVKKTKTLKVTIPLA